MNKKHLSQPSTKADIEVAVAQISTAITKALENHPTKDDHQRLETKVNQLDQKVNDLDHKVDNLASDVSDIRRRVIDLEHDTPTSSEFNALKSFVGFTYKP